MSDVVVVGSGPNGLAAAVVLAMAGLQVTVLEGSDQIGGGTRTAELTVPGVLHDVCAAVHPFGVSSPLLRSLPLDEHGLDWSRAPIDLAHPLDGGRAGVVTQSIEDTVTGLGVDGDRWRRTYAPLATHYDALAFELMQSVLHVPRARALPTLARFGPRALLPASTAARRFHTDEARALFIGMAAHVIGPLTAPATAAMGLLFGAAAHHRGWPVAKGGSRVITDALASLLALHGGSITTDTWVRSATDLPDARAVVFDLTPGQVVGIIGDQLPGRTTSALRRWRHGPAAHKVDLAVEGGVPWTNEACRQAGTVHVGGIAEEIISAEATVASGRLAERPLVLVAQQYLADPSRSAGDVHPVWAYSHVPAGHTDDDAATEALLGQLERFAPGVRERVVGMHVTGPTALEAYNPSYVGGDIAAGANTGLQLVFRPRRALDPYRLGERWFLCSGATPPGAGVHGMCGFGAARSVLKALGLPAPRLGPAQG